MQHNNSNKVQLDTEVNQQKVEGGNLNQSTLGPAIDQEPSLSTADTEDGIPEITTNTHEASLQSFSANLGIDYNLHKVEFDTRGLSANSNESNASGPSTFDCSRIPLPKAPMGSIQHGLQTLAECFLNKKSGQPGLEPSMIGSASPESELNRQTAVSMTSSSMGLQKFEQSNQVQSSAVEIQKRIEDNHKFQVVAQRQIRQMGYEPKNDIKQTQNLYDMVESQPKYIIDENKAQQLDELQPELAKTKLAKALKEVPLLKNNQIKARPSISALFFAQKDKPKDELEEELPSLGAPPGMKKKQKNMLAPPAFGKPLTLKRHEGNNYGQIQKQQEQTADQQFNLGNCPKQDDECSYDWNQTTNSRSTCSNGELNHIPSLRGSKLKNMFGSDDIEDKDELMDDIDVLEINQTPLPNLGMKRTKSNNLNNKKNLEEEKSEEPLFSQTCKYNRPMFQQQSGGLNGFQTFSKTFPYMGQTIQEAPDRKIENLHIMTKPNEDNSRDEQKTVIISVEKCDHEKDSNSKNSDNRDSCFSSKSTNQTENVSDSRSSCRTPLDGRHSVNTQSNYGSENFKNAAEEFGSRFSHQPSTFLNEKTVSNNLLGGTAGENFNTAVSKGSQDDEMSLNQSINNDELEQQNQEINEFIPYRDDSSNNQQTLQQNQGQEPVSDVQQQQQPQMTDQKDEQEPVQPVEVEVTSVDSSPNATEASPLRSQQQQREVQSLLVPTNSQSNLENQEGSNFMSLLSLMTPSHERRRPGSFQSNPTHRQSFDSLDEELEITPPTMPLTLNRQPNIVQQAPTQPESEPMQRNVSLDSTELLEINLEVALPQPLRRQNAIVPQREQAQAEDYAGMTSDQIQEAQQAALREAFGGIEEEDIDFEDLRNNLPQLVRRPGIRITNAEELNNSSSSATNGQNDDSNGRRQEEDGSDENQNNGGNNSNSNEQEAREPVIQRRQTLTELFFNQTRNAAENERREIREMVDRQNQNNNQTSESNQLNRDETANRDRQADQGANRNRDQDLTLRSIFDSVPHFNFLDNRNSQQNFREQLDQLTSHQQEGTIRNRMLRPRETRFNFGGSSSGQNANEPTLTRINRDRPFVQLYDPSVNYRQLRAQINESNQNTTSANNTNSGQGSSGRDRLGGPNSNMTNSQDVDFRDRDSISSGDEFTRIVTQAHKRSNQASKQAMEIQKFKDMTQFDQGHPKWEQEIEESLSPAIMKNLEHISKDLGVLSVLIFIRLNHFFKMTEVSPNEQSSAEIKEAHEQNAFNDSNTRGGIPCRTQNFLVFLAKRIMNLMHYNEKKEKFLFQQLASESVNEKDMSVQVLKAISICDKVFPSIDEIHYCIKKDLVQPRELIVYKMIIDLNEGLYRNCLDDQVKLSTDKADIEKVNNVFIPCCLKFYKKLTQPQMDELILVMKEINNKINDKKEKDEKNQKDMMFFRAERCNETNQLKGNAVKILLNNYPINNEQPFAVKEDTQEFLKKEDYIEFYQDLKLTVRNRMHPEFAFMSSKNLYKAANIFKEKVGGKRDYKGIKHSNTFEKKINGLPQLMSVSSVKDKTTASTDSFGSPLYHRSHTVIQKKGECSSQQNMQSSEESSNNCSSDISIRLQDSASSSKIMEMECSSISTKYITIVDAQPQQMTQEQHQEDAAKDLAGCGKTTTASSVADTTVWANSNKQCKSAASKTSDCSRKTAKKLRKQHLKAFKKRVESAYLLDNILV